MTAGSLKWGRSSLLQWISWKSHEHLRAKNSNNLPEPLCISQVVVHTERRYATYGHQTSWPLWPLSLLWRTLATRWHVVLKEVQNSSVGFLHQIVEPALSFLNIPLLPTSLNDSYAIILHCFKEYTNVIIALRKLVSIQSSVCPSLITSKAPLKF